MTALDEAVQTLRLDGMGLKGVAYRTKAQMVEALIVDHVHESHTYGAGNEVHYVNQYFNAIAPAFGLVPREDPYVSIAIPHITLVDMERCIAKTEVGLTPESLVLAMADDFQSKLKTGVVEGQGNVDLTGVVGGDQLTALFDQCELIKASKLNREFGDVPIDAFVHATPESDGMEYQLDPRPIGLARHFLDTLQRLELVDLAKTINISASDSPAGALKMHGTLLWVDKDGTCGEAKLSDLLAISPREVFQNLTKNHGMSTAEAHVVLHDLSEQVLRMTAQRSQTEVPVAWVDDLVALVRRGRKNNSLSAAWSGVEESTDTGWSKPVVLLAAKQGHSAALALLCDHGEDANARCKEGYSLATHAATRGHVDVLKILNRYRANLNGPDLSGNVPLMNATVNGHADTVKFLLEAGAEIDRQDIYGMTAVMYAASLGNPKLVSMLIDANGDLNRRDGAGRSVLQIAMSKLDDESIKRIIDQGVDVRAQDRNGASVAMYAVGFDRPDVLRMLIQTEASVDIPNKLGYTPLMVSVLKNNLSCTHVLVDAKASLNVKNNTGKNALILAVETNNVSAIETLIAAGADLNMSDSTNRDAAMIAADLGYIEIFNKLRARWYLRRYIDGGTNSLTVRIDGGFYRGHLKNWIFCIFFVIDVDQRLLVGSLGLCGCDATVGLCGRRCGIGCDWADGHDGTFGWR